MKCGLGFGGLGVSGLGFGGLGFKGLELTGTLHANHMDFNPQTLCASSTTPGVPPTKCCFMLIVPLK